MRIQVQPLALLVGLRTSVAVAVVWAAAAAPIQSLAWELSCDAGAALK